VRILAVIPARAGSKRLPGKNLRVLAGKPLLAWTIEAAARSGVFSEVLVSTDDEQTAEVARRHGASAPWLRPAALSGDSAMPVEVLLHAVEAQERAGTVPEAVMWLQPTSPFRSSATIREAARIFSGAGGLSVIGVSPAATHPYWCMSLDAAGNLVPFGGRERLSLRSQDLPPAYEVNGTIYLLTVEHLRRQGSLYTDPFRPVVVTDEIERLDIDSPFDWEIAEHFASRLG
jgi:CMP-N,N'-diacetyllegionaminic acid synthase